jgi:hypothetical protein
MQQQSEKLDRNWTETGLKSVTGKTEAGGGYVYIHYTILLSACVSKYQIMGNDFYGCVLKYQMMGNDSYGCVLKYQMMGNDFYGCVLNCQIMGNDFYGCVLKY